MSIDNRPRCSWCLGSGQELHVPYHDAEWCLPNHDDRYLFELLMLEGAQAGLSWITVLQKRENYRLAYDNFEAEKMVHYDEKKFAELLQNPGIIRNKLKVRSTVKNAKAFLQVQEEFGSFDAYIWQFVDGKTIQNSFKKMEDVPASTSHSDVMSKDLKKRGFTFVGTTICYAYMQAVGMVNDHTTDCFRWKEVKKG